MAVCNIFNPLDENKSTGTFLLFSQYTEDLIREATESEYYRVTPSKFMALDIDYSSFDNTSITKYLLDYFENGCAVCKNEMNNWTPEISKNLFWDALFRKNIDNNISILNKTENNLINEIRFVGDINMQSYNEHNGMGYSEVYCYIPTDSGQTNCSVNYNDDDKTIFTSNTTLEGYKDDLFKLDDLIKYHPNYTYQFSYEKPNNEIKKYTFNTIIVFYDVMSQTNEIYKNIPMGIYFTGIIDEGKMTNEVTKYISSPEIYDSGSAYGLKICSRFAVNPNNDNIKPLDITIDNTDLALLSHLLSQMSISQNKMDKVLTGIQDDIADKKNILALFKNSRINVPYMKEIHGKQYWFVNGRVVNIIDINNNNGGDNNQPDTKPTGFVVSMNITNALLADNEDDINCFDITKINEDRVQIEWGAAYNGKNVPATASLTINNEDPLTNIENPYKFDIKLDENTQFKLTATIDNMDNTITQKPLLVYPTYFVFTDNAKPEADDIQNAEDKKINIKSSRHQFRTYSTYNDEHGLEIIHSGYLTLAYPKEFGALTEINDEKGFNYISDFNQSIKSFNFEDKQIDYYVYTEKEKADVINYTLEFK